MQANFFNRALFKANAKAKLKGNWLVAGAITLLYLIFQGFATVGGRLLPDSKALELYYQNVAEGSAFSLPGNTLAQSFVGMALLLFSLMIGVILTLAVSRWALNLSVGSEAVGIGDFMSGFRFFLKAIGAELWQNLWVSLWSALFFVPAIIAFVFGLIAQGGSMGSEFTTLGMIAIIIGVVLYLLGIVVAIIKSISYSQMYFILSEEKIGVLRSMRISKRMTKEHLGNLFILDLSFILWWMLSALTLGLATFYVFPYYMVTTAEAYVFMRDEAFEKGILDPSEFGLMKRAETNEASEALLATEVVEALPSAEEASEATQVISEAPIFEEVEESIEAETVESSKNE